jgi:hypothetical protein
MFKATIGTNGETKNKNIINMFIFILCDTISKWNQNFFEKHSNYTFA